MNAARRVMMERYEEADVPEQEIDATKRQEGASQQKLCLRFFPLPTNKAFNDGCWLSLPYHSLVSVEGKPDFSEVTATFLKHRVRMAGRNLKHIADALEAGRLPQVVQVDPMHAAAGAQGVERLSMELIED